MKIYVMVYIHSDVLKKHLSTENTKDPLRDEFINIFTAVCNYYQAEKDRKSTDKQRT